MVLPIGTPLARLRPLVLRAETRRERHTRAAHPLSLGQLLQQAPLRIGRSHLVKHPSSGNKSYIHN